MTGELKKTVGWILVGAAAMFATNLLGDLIVDYLGQASITVAGIVAAVCFAGLAFGIGWVSKVNAVERALAAATIAGIAYTVAQPAGPALGPIEITLGVIIAWGVAAIGAVIGREVHAAVAAHEDPFDRTAAWFVKHGAFPTVALISFIILVVHAGIFRGESAGDDLTFHYAESARLADCLRIGDFDFWNPSANAGYASAYYYQVIPQLASAIPAAIFGHHLFWFQLSIVLPLVLAPAAAYRGMRLMGASPWQAVGGAFVVAFMNGASRWGSGNAGTFQVGLYTQTWALSAFPLALGHSVRWMTREQGLASAIAWGAFVFLCHPFAGVCLGLAILIGWLANIVLLGVDLVLADIATRWRPAWAEPVMARWRQPRDRERELVPELIRGAILAGALVITWLPVLLPIFVVDKAGFGGFPHRVGDEVGPGFATLAKWFTNGEILDWAPRGRPEVLTLLLPVIVLAARGSFFRWLWTPALVFALLLGLGPHLGKLGDDIFPPVRALGAMQIVLALGIGAGAVTIGSWLWKLREGTTLFMVLRIAVALTVLGGTIAVIVWIWVGGPSTLPMRLVQRATLYHLQSPLATRIVGTLPLAALLGLSPLIWRAIETEYGARTALAAIGAGIVMFVAVPGAQSLASRVRVLGDLPANNRAEMMQIGEFLGKQPQGRKQVGAGAENHWWNLLSYVYYRVPSLLQMGGGGLQASPNYDYLWTSRDFLKNAWLYDAPYLVFMHSAADKMPIGDVILQTQHYDVRKYPTPGLVSPIHVTGVLPPGNHPGEPGRKAALDWIKSDAPLRDEFLAYDGFGPTGDAPDGKMIRAWHQDSPGDEADIVAELDVAKRSTFVIRESWHPRWRAYIDGEAVPVRRVTPDFPAVDVDPGKHTLELRFERPWWAQAAWLLWPGLTVAAWLVMRRRRKPNEPTLPEARALPAEPAAPAAAEPSATPTE